ncbi:MAG: anthranilate phosphoribosyltransferase [Chloroflexota bacterium]
MSLTPIQTSIEQLFDKQNLTTEQADATMTQIMQGEATQAQIGAFLAALRMKGESVDEITGCANAMKRNAIQVNANIGNATLLDTCGTGGDGTQKFNISTIAAFIIAGAGVKVAKHGNRSNRRAGSADVLEALGITLQTTPEQAAECIEEVGIAFLFAPAYHPAAKYAVGPRRELVTRTIFNFLGPLTNPASANSQIVGVYDAVLTRTMANVLNNMGSKSAYVVHGLYETGDGLDELTTTGINMVSHLSDGKVNSFEFDATDLGLSRATLQDLQGGDADVNAGIARDILTGELHGPKRDIVLLNAAAGLSTDSGDIEAGLATAKESLDSGAAMNMLNAFVAKTQSYAG